MKKYSPLLIFCICICFSGCEDLFTTSLGSMFAQEITISSSLSVDEILSLASSSSDPSVAAAAYAAIAAKGADCLTDLSSEEKNQILSLAISASGVEDSLMASVTDIVSAVSASSDGTVDSDTISVLCSILDSMDSSVTNTDVFTALVNDSEALESASEETKALAAVLVVGDIYGDLTGDEEDASATLDAIINGTASDETTSSETQKVTDYLNTEEGASNLSALETLTGVTAEDAEEDTSSALDSLSNAATSLVNSFGSLFSV